MKKTNERVLLSAVLILASASVYYLHFLIFGSAYHIFLYLIGDIAFLPLQVMLVSLIFDRLLEDREKKNSLKKLHMIKGVFFSEVGNKLLGLFVDSDANVHELQTRLLFNNNWGNKDFKSALLFVERQKLILDKSDFAALKQFLLSKKEFMLRIIENPILLEHEQFSELMMATFHLEEELFNRQSVSNLTMDDREHINIDISRVYKVLVKEWIVYAQHLKNEYPYLFSFAARTNLFDKDAKVEIG